MKQLLEGRTAVVTGGARGIGFAVAEAFVAEGANVVLADVDGAAAATAADAPQLGGRAIGIACDVSRSNDIENLVTVALKKFGAVHVWVNNAGITRDATMRKMTESMFDEVIAVHLRGSWLGTRAAAAVMRDQPDGGAIVNLSSISGKVGMLGQTNYSSAKAGIVGLTKAAAKEVGFAGVRVNAVMPGLIRTDMTAVLRDDILADKIREIPLGRAGEAEEVAQAVLFLASDMSSYTTGNVIEVAGGRHT
ncbi:3-oxoacyl-ACP reductase FabG [Leucobacter aridicollis]|uniref:3-oxoacyl-ACP reductase FabG n=1 Tax=Leucobacter aridicollis TaxID=283878 RepID=UPI000E648B3C|nr:3-oxoacyl-ACP reductase FabG [Leucobacter aridicollis]UTX54342.1 3-oxoacyl-ACP reductase FabG [Leucobacter aridicollis]